MWIELTLEEDHYSHYEIIHTDTYSVHKTLCMSAGMSVITVIGKTDRDERLKKERECLIRVSGVDKPDIVVNWMDYLRFLKIENHCI